MNLASSIFGMNVQEINKTGHSIWTFIGTVIGLLSLSGLGFVYRHLLQRYLRWIIDNLIRPTSRGWRLLWSARKKARVLIVMSLVNVIAAVFYVFRWAFEFIRTGDVVRAHKVAVTCFPKYW